MGGKEVIKEQQGTWGEEKQVWQNQCDGVGGMHVTFPVYLCLHL